MYKNRNTETILAGSFSTDEKMNFFGKFQPKKLSEMSLLEEETPPKASARKIPMPKKLADISLFPEDSPKVNTKIKVRKAIAMPETKKYKRATMTCSTATKNFNRKPSVTVRKLEPKQVTSIKQRRESTVTKPAPRRALVPTSIKRSNDENTENESNCTRKELDENRMKMDKMMDMLMKLSNEVMKLTTVVNKIDKTLDSFSTNGKVQNVKTESRGTNTDAENSFEESFTLHVRENQDINLDSNSAENTIKATNEENSLEELEVSKDDTIKDIILTSSNKNLIENHCDKSEKVNVFSANFNRSYHDLKDIATIRSEISGCEHLQNSHNTINTTLDISEFELSPEVSPIDYDKLISDSLKFTPIVRSHSDSTLRKKEKETIKHMSSPDLYLQTIDKYNAIRSKFSVLCTPKVGTPGRSLMTPSAQRTEKLLLSRKIQQQIWMLNCDN